MQLIQLDYNQSYIAYQFLEGLGKFISIEVLRFNGTVNFENEVLEEQTIEVLIGREAKQT
jgi:polyisoprenoid-binding protein YceI